MFLSFDWAVVSFAEGVFRVTNDFGDGVYGFTHRDGLFRRMNGQLVGCQWQAEGE